MKRQGIAKLPASAIDRIFRVTGRVWSPIRGKSLRENMSNGFVVTGIPRSGTSLLCAMLSRSDTCVCFNEIHYDIDSLPLFFEEMRRKLQSHVAVPNKLDEEGELITSTDDANKHSIRKKVFHVEGEELAVGSKVTVPYLNQIRGILAQGFPTIIMIRDPVYTLGSWNSEKLSNTPLNRVMSDDLHSHWKQVRFASSEEKIARQAHIWEHYARLIWSIRSESRVRIIKYESLVEMPGEVLKELGDFIHISQTDEVQNLDNCNDDSRYCSLELIRSAVVQYCPSRVVFGYR